MAQPGLALVLGEEEMLQLEEEETSRALVDRMEDTACQRRGRKAVGGMAPSSSQIHSEMAAQRSSVVAAVRRVCVVEEVGPWDPRQSNLSCPGCLLERKGSMVGLEAQRGSAAVDIQKDRVFACGLVPGVERMDRGREQLLQRSCWVGTRQAHVCSQTVDIGRDALLCTQNNQSQSFNHKVHHSLTHPGWPYGG